MTKGIEKMAEVRYYGLGILSQLNNTKKGRVDDHFDINSVLFLFREPDIFLLTRYSPINCVTPFLYEIRRTFKMRLFKSYFFLINSRLAFFQPLSYAFSYPALP